MDKQQEKGESPDTTPLRTAQAKSSQHSLHKSGKMGGGPIRASSLGK